MNRLFCVTLMFISFFMLSEFIIAQDDITCAQYAKTAVMQNEENLSKNCGLTGSRWSSDYDYHFKWCMRVSGDVSRSETMARALALKNCGADPICKFIMRVQVQLKEIYVIDEADGGGSNAEPYLWPVFFKLDNETITQLNTENPNWIKIPNGDHGNVGNNYALGWNSNDIITIPSEIGKWSVDLNLIENNIIAEEDQKYSIAILLLVILLEEDDAPTSESIRNDYHPKFKSSVINKIRKTIAKYPVLWGPLETHDGPLLKIKNDIKSHFISGLSDPDILYIFPFLPGFVNIDDFIGVDIYRWSWFRLENNPTQTFETTWNKSTGSEDGDYKISGEIQGKIICQYDEQLMAQGIFNKLRNRWKNDHYIHIQNSKIECGAINMDWLSAQWTFEPIPASSYYRIKNRWKSDQYLHIENGNFECDTINMDWLSAQWSLEPVPNSSYYRIKNRWKDNQYIHIENGTIESSSINMDWLSAQWLLESVN